MPTLSSNDGGGATWVDGPGDEELGSSPRSTSLVSFLVVSSTIIMSVHREMDA